MTIVIALVIPEGIVLAADSQTTLSRSFSLTCGNGHPVDFRHPINAFTGSQKIFDISTERVFAAILQFGNAMPGNKPLSSHIFAIREMITQSEIAAIKDIVEHIQEYFEQYEGPSVAGLSFYVAGYDKEEIGFSPKRGAIDKAFSQAKDNAKGADTSFVAFSPFVYLKKTDVIMNKLESYEDVGLIIADRMRVVLEIADPETSAYEEDIYDKVKEYMESH